MRRTTSAPRARPDCLPEQRLLRLPRDRQARHADRPRVGARYTPDYLARWLRDPALQRPSAHMPALELTEADIHALTAYLGSLR